MRKDAKQENRQARRARLQGYHQRDTYGVNYAFQGFSKNWYFTSDRQKELDENFNRLDGKPLKGYGLEIETGFILNPHDSSMAYNILANILETAIFGIFPKDLFKQQMDSTITGTECITQVMTKEFIRNNYRNFKTMYNDLFPMFGITCDDGNCGMHVNISLGLLGQSESVQVTNVRKLFYLINRHYDLFRRALYRTGDTTWCGRMRYENAKTMDVYNMDSSHGNCFNGSHFREGRIEIRMPGGQKNFACFRNTMETIFHIVDAVKRLSWEKLDDVTAVFAGCNQYVFDRLKSYCFDNGTITQEQLSAIEPTVIHEELL